MSLLGDVLKNITAAAAEFGQTVVDGIGDVAESVTGENEITKAARAAGTTLVRGAKEVADAAIDVGEAAFETIFGGGGDTDASRRQHNGGSTPKAPDFVEPAEG